MAQTKTATEKTPDTIIIAGEIPLPAAAVRAIAGSIPGDQQDSQKIMRVASGMLRALASGGIMLSPEVVARINEAKGEAVEPEEIADLVDRALSMKRGRYEVTWTLDPSEYEAAETVAEASGFDGVQELMNNLMATVMDEEWLFKVDPRPKRVLMHEEWREEIEEILGAKFENGFELLKAIRAFSGQNFLDQVER